MSPISELPFFPAPPVPPPGAGYKSAKAGADAAQPQSVATAAVQEEPPAARRQASELTRSQSAELRLKRNRLEEGPSPSGPGSPEAELSFGDFIDLINPLHHIPIIGTIYRAITGDEIGGPAKILGGMLFGGPIGFIAAAFDTILTQATGRDLGETVVAAFIGSDAAPAVQVADAPDIESPDIESPKIQSMAAPEASIQDGASEVNPVTDNGVPSPITSYKDPFGLHRKAIAPIAATPGALLPIEVTSAALPPGPLAAAIPNAGPKPVAIAGVVDGETDRTQSAQGGIPLRPVSPGPGALPVPIVVRPVSADAFRPGTQRLIPNFAATDRGFTERMLEALDKYQAQATERLRDKNHATDRLDLEL